MTQATEEMTLAEVAAELADIARRVTRLEDIARRALPSHYLPELDDSRRTTTVEAPAPTATVRVPVSTEYDTSDTPSSNGSTPTGVDYGAVAYGLTDLKRKIQAQLGSSSELDSEYRGLVEWFAGCFQGDASFDRAAFQRQAGV